MILDVDVSEVEFDVLYEEYDEYEGEEYEGEEYDEEFEGEEYEEYVVVFNFFDYDFISLLFLVGVNWEY